MMTLNARRQRRLCSSHFRFQVTHSQWEVTILDSPSPKPNLPHSELHMHPQDYVDTKICPSRSMDCYFEAFDYTVVSCAYVYVGGLAHKCPSLHVHMFMWEGWHTNVRLSRLLRAHGGRICPFHERTYLHLMHPRGAPSAPWRRL